MTDQQPTAENPFAALAEGLNAAIAQTAFRLAAAAAIGAALNGNDDRLVAARDGLDADQAGALVDAASAVGYAAARRRRTLLADDDQADEGDERERAILGALAEVEQQRDEQRARAEQAEELVSIAHDTSNTAERERARAIHRAEQAEEETRLLRNDLAHARAAGASYRRRAEQLAANGDQDDENPGHTADQQGD